MMINGVSNVHASTALLFVAGAGRATISESAIKLITLLEKTATSWKPHDASLFRTQGSPGSIFHTLTLSGHEELDHGKEYLVLALGLWCCAMSQCGK